jgi:CDP-glucose 4,6-dehydratase
LRTNNREIELGKSLHAWLRRLGIPIGGKSMRDVRDQAERLSRCRRACGEHQTILGTGLTLYLEPGPSAFAEGNALGGKDPYSASKAAAEIAVACWRDSFPKELPPLATARAGNVIGGGDFSEMRIIPDLVRAQLAGEALVVRRPDATCPFQHVVDVLRGYLVLAERLAVAPHAAPPALNFGPRDGEIRVRDLLGLWGDVAGRQADGPVMDEARRLALDSTLVGAVLGWQPLLDTPRAIAATAAWYAAWRRGEDMARTTDAEIAQALAPRALAA